MKRCFLIIAGLLAVLAGPVGAQTPVGVNELVENSVQTRSVGETGWRPSIVDGTVHQADAIVTGADSRLLIRLRDQSALTVGANAALNVDQFVVDTEPEPAGVLVSMVRGAFRFVSGSRGAEREQVAFRTPTATIGIRGTIIEASVGAEALELLDGEAGASVPGDDPEQAAVIVLVEGEIEIEADGVRRVVREPGLAVAVRGRRVSEPFRLSPEAGRRLAGRLPPLEPGGPGAGPQGQAPGSQPPQGEGAEGQAAQGQTPASEGSKGEPARIEASQEQAPRDRGARSQGGRGATPRPGSAGPSQRPGPGGG